MPAKIETHAKLILFGEHAAVYGYPALGTSLPWKMSLKVQKSSKYTWETSCLSEADLLNIFPKMHHSPPFTFQIRSDIPNGVGFGSSSALCVSLVKGIAHYLQDTSKDNPSKLWLKAHELEKKFHQTPSGIDTGLSLHGGACFFEGKIGELPSIQRMHYEDLPLVVGAIPRKSKTKELIHQVRTKMDNSQEDLIRLGEIAREATNLLTQNFPGRLQSLGGLSNEAHQILSSLNLSTSLTDKILEEGIKLGAHGGKLSGGGGGGAYFLIAKSIEHANQMALELAKFCERESIPQVVPPTRFNERNLL